MSHLQPGCLHLSLPQNPSAQAAAAKAAAERAAAEQAERLAAEKRAAEQAAAQKKAQEEAAKQAAAKQAAAAKRRGPLPLFLAQLLVLGGFAALAAAFTKYAEVRGQSGGTKFPRRGKSLFAAGAAALAFTRDSQPVALGMRGTRRCAAVTRDPWWRMLLVVLPAYAA